MSHLPIGAADFAAVTADDLVTGEAVALDLPPASLGHRIVSGLVDIVVTLVLLLIVLFVFVFAALPTDGALLHVAQVGTMVLVFLVWPTAWETLTRGRSLGKLAMGLRTVRDDAGPISFQHAFVRALIGFVEIYFSGGAPAFFSSMLSSRGKRLGDYAAGTYVVRERVRLALPPPPPMPHALAGWAATADIASLPTGLTLAVRQFLAGVHRVEPASRHALAVSLAQQASAYVAPLPPPGTHPEAFLAAVVAARRQHDSARLAREAQLRHRLLARR
ncbi:MAG: RDD family protein [Nocardioides sp.]